jgi:hypothetical protein
MAKASRNEIKFGKERKMAIRKRKEKSVEDELIDNLLAGYETPNDVMGEGGLLAKLTKRLLERAMAAE